MNFFENQDRARRKSRYLLLIFIIAVLGIVLAVDLVVATISAGFSGEYFVFRLPDPAWFADNTEITILTSLGTVAFVGFASLYRTVGIRAGGGGKVARDVGATLVSPDTRDPVFRQLRNIVEEMAIASGVPVPDVYVLEEESGINAFAAGYEAGDAVVAVTRGCLNRLSRDELQGVIAHEFSHILNGDMRINIRLIGILFGILAIGLIGRTVLRGLRFRGSGRKGGGTAVVVLAGAALFIIGYIGLFFGRLIKAAVSRQREYLADASAVQFTRQTDGIAGALKKIGGFSAGSELSQGQAEEVSHMLFATGLRLSSLLATHPPLIDRIRAIDPQFDPAAFAAIAGEPAVPQPELVSGLAPAPESGQRPYRSDPDVMTLDAGQIAAFAGRPTDAHLARASAIRAAMPAALVDAARSREGSVALSLALLLDHNQNVRQHQQGIIAQRLEPRLAEQTTGLYEILRTLGPEYRMPVLDLVLPGLRTRPIAELEHLGDLIRRIIEADGRINTLEYALSRMMRTYLTDAHRRSATSRQPRRTVLIQSVSVLFSLIAHHGHSSRRDAEAAYQRGMKSIAGRKADRMPSFDPPVAWTQALDLALTRLDGASFKNKRRIVAALIDTITHDGTVTMSEAELLRAVCACLHVPLPPLLPVTNVK